MSLLLILDVYLVICLLFLLLLLFTSQLLHSLCSINLISSLFLLYYFNCSFIFFFVFITDEERTYIYTVVILEPSHFILCCYFPVNYFVRASMKNSVFLI